MSSGIRLGVVNETVLDGPAWRDHVRRVEDAGIGAFLVRDHFSAGAFGQQFAPFTALATAAAITTTLRVGSMVLDNDFRHPVLVAHEAASLHVLSGGRFDLGLGAGWYRPEYEAAGIAFEPARQRIDRLVESVGVIGELFAGAAVHRSGGPYQLDGLALDALPALHGRPRLLIGAGGPRMLGIAARHADVVGVLPAPIKGSDDPDNPRDRLPGAFQSKIAVLRDAAGDRYPGLEISAFATFRVTGRRRADTEELIRERGWDGIDAEQVWRMPTIHIGSAAQIRDDLRARRDQLGLTYLIASDRDLPAVAEIASGL